MLFVEIFAAKVAKARSKEAGELLSPFERSSDQLVSPEASKVIPNGRGVVTLQGQSDTIFTLGTSSCYCLDYLGHGEVRCRGSLLLLPLHDPI